MIEEYVCYPRWIYKYIYYISIIIISINYLNKKVVSKLEIKTVKLSSNNKLQALLDLINHLGNQTGIVFCNLRDSIDQVSRFLDKNKVNIIVIYI